jgi:hypothetical protein
MKILNKILIVILLPLFSACADYSNKNINTKMEKEYFLSKGFVLVYEESLFENKIVGKKINNNDNILSHSLLKPNTTVRVTNLDNLKSFETKVSRKNSYPKIFNGLISQSLAQKLELDLENPYVEILEIKKNKKFIAKESNTFDEEKNVAEKAPVEKIKVNIINDNSSSGMESKKTDKKFLIIISDFYYEDSAIKLKEHLEKSSNLKTIFIKKINKNKYRLSVGPFKNFNSLKSSYISLNNLGFDDLNILRK